MQTKSNSRGSIALLLTLLTLGGLGPALAGDTVHVLPGAAETAGALGSRSEPTL